MRVVACLAAISIAGCGKAIDHPKVEDKGGLLPATLEAQKPRTGDARPVPVRVWVDPIVRKDPAYKERITDEVDYANQLLGPLVSARLEIKEWKDWERKGELGTATKDLADADKGDGVAWVIGYVAPSEKRFTAQSELGVSEPLGRYVVVRAWATDAETDALREHLPTKLPKNERAEVLGAHRRHKQAVILLHQLARTMGAIAENEPAWIQHNAYGPKQTSFSERNRELLQVGIDGRLAKKPDGQLAAELLAKIEASEWGGWVGGDREAVVGRLRNIVDAGKEGQTAADVPSAAYSQFDKARTLSARGRHAEALAELEPLLAAYPANATMRLLACQIELRKGGPTSDAAKKACTRATELAAGDPRPHITIAGALLASHDVAAARKELVQAEKKIGNLPRPEDAWLELAQLYQGMGAITWAEDAIAKTSAKDHAVGAWAKSVRARYGVPKGAVKPEEEAAAVTAVRQILDQVYASKFAEADRAAKIAAKRWPKLPGLEAARCDLALRKSDLGGAKKRCADAIAAYPDASWAQYLMGIIILRGNDTQAGIDHLRKAITVDPELAQAWRALAKALVRAKDKTGLDKLKTEYQEKFGQPLGD